MLAMPALRRPGLLLSAVVAITVPGVLAVIALLGPDHAATRATAFAGGGAGEATAGSGELYDYAESAQDGMGIQLLGESAAASLAASYQGVELLAQWGVTGPDTIVSDVWHSGGVTVTQTSDAAMLTGTQPYVSYDADDRSPEGVFGVTKTLVSLLGQHYVAVYQGTGSAVGRPALIVELHRADGSLAARFWLDRQTMVPLRREVFDTSAQLISEEAFAQVQFGALTKPPAPAAASARQGQRRGHRRDAVRIGLVGGDGPGAAARGPEQAGLAAAGLPPRRPAAVLGGAQHDRGGAGAGPRLLRRALGRLALRAARHARAAAWPAGSRSAWQGTRSTSRDTRSSGPGAGSSTRCSPMPRRMVVSQVVACRCRQPDRRTPRVASTGWLTRLFRRLDGLSGVDAVCPLS